jgi:hypothetical protein
MALLQLLKMTGKGKKAFLLLKRVLLQLPKMAGCGAATAAKDGVIAAAKNGWQRFYCSC